MSNSLLRDRCPLCGAGSITLVGPLAYRGQIEFSSGMIELEYVPELWFCGQCTSRFVQHAVTEEAARQLYADGRAGERWSAEKFSEAKTPEAVNVMTQLFKQGGHVLDVGCNTGELLDYARDLGCETAGVELSAESRSVLEFKRHKSYASLDDVSGTYELITAFDLFEHLYDVRGFLAACRSRLASGGKLAILTGNVGSVSARVAGINWWYAQYPEHIVFPSKKFFAEFSGFRLDAWLPTYASRGYKLPVYRAAVSMLKSAVRRRPYTGLPSLGADHALVVLT
ncbi:MAG TPA: class I SAM-dependent methyltransferase [Gallionellaceae bacterium]|nr:class I SAM-dependent methyltransferase [Gallionellaceae bacterium]